MNRYARWATILGIGLMLTLGTAGLAAWTTPTTDQRLLTFVVFALCTSPVFIGGAWALIPDAAAPAPPEHTDDTVEHNWFLRATSGAFTDLLTAMGLTLVATSVLATPAVPLVVFVGLGMLDTGVRYLVLSKREA